MTFHTDAIYEGGVLRPLAPLNLGENQVVSVAISTEGKPVSPEAHAAAQRGILAAYVSKVEARRVDAPDDGLTNRDHDPLIYGE